MGVIREFEDGLPRIDELMQVHVHARDGPVFRILDAAALNLVPQQGGLRLQGFDIGQDGRCLPRQRARRSRNLALQDKELVLYLVQLFGRDGAGFHQRLQALLFPLQRFLLTIEDLQLLPHVGHGGPEGLDLSLKGVPLQG